jgi:hypothetical protein
MLKILEAEAEIRQAQAQFEKVFDPFEKVSVTVGYQGGNDTYEVSLLNDLRIWAGLGKEITSRGESKKKRYWNIFGVEIPKQDDSIGSDCQINSPVSGIDRGIGGAFAKDREGKTFVVHRGIVTGQGMTKAFFKANYQGKWVDIEDGEKGSKVVLIGAVDSPDFLKQLAHFVHEVKRIKGLVSKS